MDLAQCMWKSKQNPKLMRLKISPGDQKRNLQSASVHKWKIGLEYGDLGLNLG